MIGQPRLVLAVVVAASLFVGSAAAAQSPNTWPGTLELSVGAGWSTGYALGTQTAGLKANDTVSQPFALFRFEGRRASSGLVDARAGWRLGGRFAVEARVTYARPALKGSISGDPEAAEQRLADERLSQYGVDGSLVWHMSRPAIGRRARSYVLGGAGYLRELHAGRTLAESGRSFHAGGGVKVALMSAPDRFVKGVGLRIEGRATMRSGAADFDDRRRAMGSATGSLMFLF